MIIRHAVTADLDALHRLRNDYIPTSYATFDEDLMSREAVDTWIKSFGRTGPHRLYVSMEDDELLGFAGSQQYRSHRAFRKTIETSIYVSPKYLGRGIGSALYEALFKDLSDEDVHSAVVGIALPNEASVRLHKKVGFTEVGTFKEYAIKHGRFMSSLWMQRSF
ncbi:GNAT family N-acetyltransferase [Paraburkholderia bryophila]|uniref:Phosphinothricin acetyltransferase n=1 Tax=Paraburkholderia bryophila TaxID=420952 RepID=A0A329BNJ1_9BURK|nr:GNAT family N-acetyltransferase [Paraburkholderia bryophila]RAS23889.1 phosphinothricin acetyltransferase [Paraburkholderia bryophila]